MAAGLGFKDFTTGEVLTAADVDGYLMQGIWVFASAAARNAAVTAPAEGNFAFTKDTNSLWYYDGAAWVASGATGDIEGVTAGVGISGGGTSGTVTVTNSMATAITTAGDTLYGTGSGTFSRLGIGTAGQVLKVNSGATAPEWGAAGGASGMTLITSQDFTTSASISVNDVFSATYLNYFVIISSTPTSTFDLDMRFRVGGSDNSTNNYYAKGVFVDSGGISANTSQVGTSDVRIGGSEVSSNSAFCQLWISAPFATRQTLYFTQNTNKDRYKSANGLFDGTTSFTGFTFYPNANNMTGNVKVYGLANS